MKLQSTDDRSQLYIKGETHCTQTGRLNKDVNSPQTDLLIECSSYQNPSKVSGYIDKISLQLTWKCNGTRILKRILKKKRKGET